MTTSGFYKSDLTFAPNWVIAPGFELLRSAKDSYTYPVEGWYWFDSLEQACTFFDVPLPDEFNNGTEFIPSNGEANWPGFNLAISLDQSMVTYEVAANQIHPSIVGKKDLAYSIIADKGLDNFASIFPLFCQIAEVSTEHREAWAQLAESFNLPSDFVVVVRG